MTILIEYRWKCDYDKCGAVSPPVQIGERPLGWVEAPGWVTLNGGPKLMAGFHHVCCNNHAEQYRKEWEKLHND